MRRKTSAILAICIVIGAFGITFGIIALTQPESINPLVFLLINPSSSPPKLWTWVSGNYTLTSLGNYGTKGVADDNNVPGARHRSISWIDSDDTLWLFGGQGFDNNSDYSQLNDLWKFNGTHWTWVSGGYSVNNFGNYGKKGVADTNNIPGARGYSVSWIDSNDTLWLFGGYGFNNESGPNCLSDLWKFNSTHWTWVSGTYLTNQLGIYGTKGVADASNVPGARYLSLSWIDSKDNLWLFGGYGFNNNSATYLNDLWKFNGTHWTWVSGSYLGNNYGNYGTKGVADANNVPGARYGSNSWIDSNDTLWLFGGYGFNNYTAGCLNDLWKFNGTHWTWVSGTYLTNQLGIYGKKGVAGTSNVPGARQYSISWIDSNDTLWLFGGWDKNANYLNDLWKFDGMHWTWVSGTDLTNQLGIYGTKGVADSSNVPGARNYGISWIDSNNTLWLFGGYGYSNETGPNCLNDLWKCECCH